MSRTLKSNAGSFTIAEMSDISKSITIPTKLNTQDLNELKTPGVYYFSGDGVTNLPTGVTSYGVVIVLRAAASVYRQIVTAAPSKFFMRNSSGDTWGDWYSYSGIALA